MGLSGILLVANWDPLILSPRTLEPTRGFSLHKILSALELCGCYALDVEELEWVCRNARGKSSRLGLLVLQKILGQMRYFSCLDVISKAVVEPKRMGRH